MSIIDITTSVTQTWVCCPYCWGQRRIFEDRNGEGLVPHTCPSCLGIGETVPLPS